MLPMLDSLCIKLISGSNTKTNGDEPVSHGTLCLSHNRSVTHTHALTDKHAHVDRSDNNFKAVMMEFILVIHIMIKASASGRSIENAPTPIDMQLDIELELK